MWFSSDRMAIQANRKENIKPRIVGPLWGNPPGVRWVYQIRKRFLLCLGYFNHLNKVNDLQKEEIALQMPSNFTSNVVPQMFLNN